MLLAAATVARPGQRVADFGAGVGAAGLALARRVGGLDLVLVEIDEELAALACGNAQANGIAAHVVALDVTADAAAFAAAGLGSDSVDAVLMNPPFNDAARHQASPDTGRQVAHVAPTGAPATWIHAARRALKSGGTLTLIWRAEGLGEVLAALDRGFGSLEILPVHPAPDRAAIRVLVRAVKGGRAPMLLHPGLMLGGDRAADAAIQSVLCGEATLPLGPDRG
jgi:tRNA1(Val) A37 N6-methylase TrmN6